MLPIVIKDLVENLRTWLILFAGITATNLAVHAQPPAAWKSKIAVGFLFGLSLSGGLIFTQSVVNAERKRNHLVLLRSLPITGTEIVGAKFLSALVLGLSLTALGTAEVNLLFSTLESAQFFTAGLFLVPFICLTLFFTMTFNNPAAAMIPIYLSLAVFVILEPHLAGVAGFSRSVLARPLVGIVMSWGVGLACFLGTVAAYRRKETSA